MSELYLEDLAVGQTFVTDPIRIDADQIKAFAAEYDPQPFHMDEDAAAQTLFGGLAASGWHTAALTGRLLVTGPMTPVGGIVGAGATVEWVRPVRPGDELHGESEVMEVRPSQSRPGQGLLTLRTTTLNQRGEPVLVLTAKLVVRRKPDRPSPDHA